MRDFFKSKADMIELRAIIDFGESLHDDDDRIRE